ncbi:EEF1A lysine methyltransferase 1 isoform X2 [Echinops telfairi]|uniref:EEF1A lysine methyltransferase 1 isoform X2 n=1 Tax=Echinops telfairi TaxID=9371 RepID=A0AC55DE05_ECHTE|nr:EEF1A lysine methyltransferase 1 isoform X2 [Echinops telfairi]
MAPPSSPPTPWQRCRSSMLSGSGTWPQAGRPNTPLEHWTRTGIACVSAPSVYQKLRQRHGQAVSVYIFEYDRRFAVYGEEFIFYDYNKPLELPARIAAHSFDIVVADPPYLSEECLRKTSETIQYLAQGKILLCTGAIMEEAAATLLGVKRCKFIPQHTRNLANEFRCYVNYDSGLDQGL